MAKRKAAVKRQAKVEETKQSAQSSRVAELQADLGRQIQKLRQEINRLQAIPKASDGRTENLGNAPTPPPGEPTQNEPGSIIFQNPPDPSASVPSQRVQEVVRVKR